MKVETVKINKIRPYEKNPRRNDDAVEAVANSIRTFGWQQPIVVDADGVIIAGHTRYKAAKHLGLKEVPVVYADLDEDKARAYRIADNSTGGIASWDWDLLTEELDAIDIDMGQYGLTTDDYIETESVLEDIDDPEPPAVPEEPTTKKGQIFRLGDHVLMCGDATSAEDMERLMDAMGGGPADMIMTDPPYNVAIGDKNARLNELRGANSIEINLENDVMDGESFHEFLTAAMTVMHDALKEGGVYYCWYAGGSSVEFRTALGEARLGPRQVLIWVKGHFTLSMGDYQNHYEPCLYGWKEGSAHYFIADRTQTTVYEFPHDLDKMKAEDLRDLIRRIYAEIPQDVIREKKPNQNRLHPTMKPIPLLARLIFNSSRPGDIVLDPFGGSGSTMLACEQLRRRCAMIEIDPHYCDVIIKRWEDYTGKKAELIA